MAARSGKKQNGKALTGQASVNSAIKSICDIMRRSNCAGALQYVPELTWILFLRILDERETNEADEAEALGLTFTPSLAEPFRWRDWAAPVDGTLRVPDSAHGVCGLQKPLRADKKASLFDFVRNKLLPHLKSLKDKPGGTARQKVISQIMSGVDRSRIDSEKNFADVAERTGIDRAAICRLENGQHQNPTIGTLNRYADALGKRLSIQVVDVTKRRRATR
jgi:type I restriction enzyme M protein